MTNIGTIHEVKVHKNARGMWGYTIRGEYDHAVRHESVWHMADALAAATRRVEMSK